MPRRRRRSSPTVLIVFILFAVLAVYYFTTGSNPFGIFPKTPPLPTVLTNVANAPTSAAVVTGNWWEVYFTDPLNINNPEAWQDSVEGRLIEKINAANRSIHIASFEFNLTPVAEALISAKQRGVDVRWVTDDEYGLESDSEPDHGQFAMLQQAGIEVRSDTRSALMHNKFWIFDGETVWTGSTNITANGIFDQNNNVLVIRSPELAALYEAEFQEMWDGQFGPSSPSRLAEQDVNQEGSQIFIVFTPEDSALESFIVPIVGAAQQSVRFMAFSFTDYPLAETMIEQSQSGVDVAGVFENFGSDTDAAEFDTLSCANVPVRRDGNPGFLHHKVIVIDGRIVLTGSLNYSTNAETSNDENLIIVDNSEIAGLYMQEFERVWALAKDPQPGEVTCPQQ